MEWITQILLTIFLLVLGAYLMRIWQTLSRFSSLFNKFPGPSPHFLFGNLKEYLVPAEELVQVFFNRVRKYGPIVRIWNIHFFDGELFVSKPEYLELLLSSTQHIKKSSFYDRLTPWIGRGLLTSTGSKWHKHRKLITPTFHFKILEEFYDIIAEKSSVLVEQIGELPMNTEVDLMPLIHMCTLDIICETAMGAKMKLQESKEDGEYIKAVKDLNTLQIYREFRPWLHPDFIFYKTAEGKRYSKCLHILHGFTLKVIQERKLMRLESKKPNKEDPSNIESKKRSAFLDMLLETQDGPDPLTDLEIREEVDTFMFEGHDTTASGITWSLYLLGRHPHIQDLVVEELERILPNSKPLSFKNLNELKYLECVIKESLRLYPSVPLVARDLEHDFKLDENYIIPANCTVTMDIINAHRNPEQFPNPEVFDPENFLPDRVRKRHPFAYIPFSAGPRNCIGQKFAMMEEKTVLTYILRNYKVEATDENNPPVFETTLKPSRGLHVKLSNR